MSNHIFLHTKLLGGIIVFLLSSLSLQGQSPQLEVEGDVKIRGYQDIHHLDDTTSMYIGLKAGLNIDYSSIVSTADNTIIISSDYIYQVYLES